MSDLDHFPSDSWKKIEPHEAIGRAQENDGTEDGSVGQISLEGYYYVARRPGERASEQDRVCANNKRNERVDAVVAVAVHGCMNSTLLFPDCYF